MKNTLIILAIILTSNLGQAQFDHMFLRIGWQTGSTKISPQLYSIYSIDGTNQTTTFGREREATIYNKHVPVDLEVLTKNALFNMGFSAKLKSKKGHKTSPNTRGMDGPGFYTKLAFGGYFGESVGLFIGGQYTWAPMELTQWETSSSTNLLDIRSGASGPGEYRLTYSGGHQRGLGAHILININNQIGWRNSFMYDKISRKGIPGNVTYNDYLMEGIGITGESSIYLMFDEDNNFGISIGAIYSTRNMTFGYSGENEGFAPVAPEHTLSGLNFNINLLIPADWMGGQSYTTTTIRVVD